MFIFTIRHLAAHYPRLATIDANGHITLNIRILKTQSSTGRVLQLGSGASDLERFIGDYLGEVKSFKAPGLHHPVVLLVDNDTGADTIFNRIKSLTKKTVSRNDPYTHVSGNLYVASTPVPQGATKSAIEDFLPNAVKNVNLGGKTFSAQNKADSTNHFGKAVLAHYVRENAAKIDFSAFSGILDRITAAVEAHAAKHPQAVTATGAAAVSI